MGIVVLFFYTGTYCLSSLGHCLFHGYWLPQGHCALQLPIFFCLCNLCAKLNEIDSRLFSPCCACLVNNQHFWNLWKKHTSEINQASWNSRSYQRPKNILNMGLSVCLSVFFFFNQQVDKNYCCDCWQIWNAVILFSGQGDWVCANHTWACVWGTESRDARREGHGQGICCCKIASCSSIQCARTCGATCGHRFLRHCPGSLNQQRREKRDPQIWCLSRIRN